MGEWKKTACILCAQGCGIEVYVEDNKIQRVRADKDNARTKGYCCRKARGIANYEHSPERLLYPLKKVGDHHERISWEQAISEISVKMLAIKEQYGPRSISFMGGGGQGGHFEAPYFGALCQCLGTQYHYSPLAQEFSNVYWVEGRLVGRQAVNSHSDIKNADTVVAWGWNGWISHQITSARTVLGDLVQDPNRKLIVIDPRKTETAEKSDIHLAVREGTDSILLKAMINIVIKEGWVNESYIAEHVNGWEEIKPWFQDFDAKRGIEVVCGLDYETVYEVTKLIATTKSCIRPDLGIFMGRNSTINNYMIQILRIICGRSCVEGGQIYNASLMFLGADSKEYDPNTWRTLATNIPPVMGKFPPAVFPDEVLSDNPERLRSVFISQCNPLRSYPDTKAYEKAMERLDLSVCMDAIYTETARLCDYVLPTRSFYETYEATFFPRSFPDVYLHMRQPVVEPPSEECKYGCDILLDLARGMGFIPELPDYLYENANEGITNFAYAVYKYVMDGNADKLPVAPFIIGETLGKAMGSANKANLVTVFVASSDKFKAGAVKKGFPEGVEMFEALFNATMEHPEGLIVSRFVDENNFGMLETKDKKFALKIDELEVPIANITIEKEIEALKMPEEYPIILNSGYRIDTNADSNMRNPKWNKYLHAGSSMLISAEDAKNLGIENGEKVRIVTEVSSAEIIAEISERTCKGYVCIPHGFGMNFNGEKIGVNVNELTPCTNRDEWATPIHRRVPCRIEKI